MKDVLHLLNVILEDSNIVQLCLAKRIMKYYTLF